MPGLTHYYDLHAYFRYNVYLRKPSAAEQERRRRRHWHAARFNASRGGGAGGAGGGGKSITLLGQISQFMAQILFGRFWFQNKDVGPSLGAKL